MQKKLMRSILFCAGFLMISSAATAWDKAAWQQCLASCKAEQERVVHECMKQNTGGSSSAAINLSQSCYSNGKAAGAACFDNCKRKYGNN